jgi:hypothetical protein
MEIHFWLARDRIHPEHTSCYIRGGQVIALYDEFLTRGVPQLSDFAVRPLRRLRTLALLLDAGADPAISGPGGETPAEIARRRRLPPRIVARLAEAAQRR